MLHPLKYGKLSKANSKYFNLQLRADHVPHSKRELPCNADNETLLKELMFIYLRHENFKINLD